MNEGDNNDNKNTKTPSRCFVCDDEFLGRSYALATCKTQHSRTRIIEKLGELVGEGYLVVIAEDDVICHSCGILVNTLDRLEVDMHKIRDCILHLFERKYSLEDGELHDNKPKPCQPPQITRSNLKNNCGQSQNENDLADSKKTAKRSRCWLQCDKCKFTTDCNSFITLHMKDHSKQKLFCEKYEQYSSEHQPNKSHSCNTDSCEENNLANKENEADNSNVIIKNDAVEMTLLKQAQPILPVIQTLITDSSNCDRVYLPNTLYFPIPASDSTTSQQPICVQQSTNMADINNSRKRIRLDSNPIQEIETKDKRTKVENRY